MCYLDELENFYFLEECLCILNNLVVLVQFLVGLNWHILHFEHFGRFTPSYCSVDIAILLFCWNCPSPGNKIYLDLIVLLGQCVSVAVGRNLLMLLETCNRSKIQTLCFHLNKLCFFELEFELV